MSEEKTKKKRKPRPRNPKTGHITSANPDKDILNNLDLPADPPADPATLPEEDRAENFKTTPELVDKFFNLLYTYQLNYVKAAREIGVKDPRGWFERWFNNSPSFQTRYLSVRDEIVWEIAATLNDAAMNPADYRGANFTPAIFLLKSYMPNTFGDQYNKKHSLRTDNDDEKQADRIGAAIIKQLKDRNGKV